MKTTLAITLLITGLFWLWHSAIVQLVATNASLSDAMSFQSKLKSWADSKVSLGKLNSDDISEIFHDGYLLKLSGENPKHTFNEMITVISRRNALPIWPGFVLVIIGIAGLISKKKEVAEHAPPEGRGEAPRP